MDLGTKEPIVAQNNQKHNCNLFPVVREDVLTMQEVKQQSGWNITAFNLPSAWKHTRGENVKVAIIDSGVELDHPDLVENLLPGKNFVDPNKSPVDNSQTGHGSHVAGIICAADNNIGVVGVAPKSKVIPIKALDRSGNGDMMNVAAAIRWAVDEGAEIITMSIGSPNKVQEVRKAIQYAYKNNVPVFVAAGNSGFTKDVFYPAAYPESIAIGSIDENFNRSSFSCTGKNLDFMAPGNRIISTVPKHWYAFLSGTSMACPFAAGIAALLLSYAKQHPRCISLKTVEDYRKILRKYTTDITSETLKNKEFYQGLGIIDPRKLMEIFKS